MVLGGVVVPASAKQVENQLFETVQVHPGVQSVGPTKPAPPPRYFQNVFQNLKGVFSDILTLGPRKCMSINRTNIGETLILWEGICSNYQVHNELVCLLLEDWRLICGKNEQ